MTEVQDRQFHVLIVDDNKSNVQVLREMILIEGGTITGISNPSSLEAQLESMQRPDLIFVDIEMPLLNGYEVLKLIKDSPAWQGIPVIAHTVHSNEINEARKNGFDGFVPKPLNVDEFPARLEQLLGGEAVWTTD